MRVGIAQLSIDSKRVLASAMLFAFAACTPIGTPATTHDAAVAGDASHSVQLGRGVLAACKKAADCKSPNPCLTLSCEGGMCHEQAAADGVALPDEQQVKGDCQVLVCNANGEVQPRPDDTDKPPSDTNPCHVFRCKDGQQVLSNASEATGCNGTGTCKAGMCSVCVEGQDCSAPEHCTIHIFRCTPKGAQCEDTGVARGNQSCGAGKICEAGSCVPCMVGSECKVDDPCYSGHITSCEPEMVCDSQPVMTGKPCGSDERGQPLFCSAGKCTAACRQGSCAPDTDPCMESHWDCSMPGAPMCVTATRDDGEACADNSICHAGVCSRTVLINGDFSRGLEGWTLTGDASKFLVSHFNGAGGRATLSTSPDGVGSGSAAVGTASQRFMVPMDALALRFVVTGGHAHVKLKDASGAVLEDCVGRDSVDLRIPVSWDLMGLRGQQVELSIEDQETTGMWGYVFTTGFDVIRDVKGPLRNPLFAQGLSGWETTGDGQRFNIAESYNVYDGLNVMTDGVKMYGRRLIVSSYTTDASGQTTQATSQGSLSQTFTVPKDAVALRFDVFGGRTDCRVKLTQNDQVLYEASGVDSDGTHLPVSWSLEEHRGKQLRLTFEDHSLSPNYGWLGVTGFDVITSWNGF